MNKLEYNKRMVGKTVIVSSKHRPEWQGTIVDVINEDEFVVTDPFGKNHNISMFDIRSTTNEKTTKR
tara:strand:- start:284 stop:484 length:201 start_codon:yes stop_codon:yes gene_type:complete